MQLSTRLPKRRSPRPTEPRTPKPAARPDASGTRDARRGDGPQDRALYTCMCGFAFTAKVTTSVDCPHCGTEQAW